MPPVIPAEGHAKPMGVVGYFFREASRRLWKYKRTSGVAIAMISISLIILGTFLLISENLTASVDRWQGQSELRIYLHKDATPAQTEELAAFLRSERGLSNFRYVTAEQALAKFKKHFANISGVVGQLEENPFPPSFEVEVVRATIDSPRFSKQIESVRNFAAVDEVQFDWEWVSRLRRLVNVLNAIGFFAGGLLAIAAAFTIANVIRLTMVLYREEIDIMRLVGATENIVRGPFLIEGILQGLIGGIVAVLLLYGGFALAARLTSESLGLLWNFLFVTFLPWYKSVALVAGGIAAGLLGSWMSIREYPQEFTGPTNA